MPTYRLTGRLSSGELYERHAGLTEDGQPVAIQLFSERASEPKLLQAIADAGRQIASGAPALLAPSAAGMVKKRLAVAFPMVDGVTLQSALTRMHNREVLLQPPVTLALVLELLDALSRAGERGAWHGALTPDAIFLDQQLGVRIADFGVGPASAALSNLRKLLWPKAKEPYRAPESAQGQPPSEAGDVYAAGALAYELFTLHKPGGDKAQVSARREAPAAPSRLDRRINPRLDPVLLKALEYSPQRRYRTCQELAQALRSAAAAVGGAAATSEVRKVSADLRAREEDRTLGPPPWPEAFPLESLGDVPAAPDRTEVAAVPDVLPRKPPSPSPSDDGRYDRTQVDPRSISQETPQLDDGGWNKDQETISTVDDAARKGVLRPIRPDSADGAIPEDAPGRTRPMRPKGAKGAPQKGKGFMPVRVDAPPRSESPRGESARSESPARPLMERPSGASAPPPRPHRSPTLVVLLDTLRRRKRMLWRIAVLAALVAVGALYGIQRMEKARREREVAALFGGPTQGTQTPPVEPVRPPLPKEIAATPEYVTPGPDGAAFLTVLADVPAWVLIDGARLPRNTPVFKVPVPPGNHVVVVMDGSGATREQEVPFKAGELQRMDVKLSRRTTP